MYNITQKQIEKLLVLVNNFSTLPRTRSDEPNLEVFIRLRAEAAELIEEMRYAVGVLPGVYEDKAS
jgi:hypothetical protein